MNVAKSPKLVFVYGTLRRGELRAGVMEAGGEFLSEAVTVPGFSLFDLGAFPAMVQTDELSSVDGELWRVTPGTLEQLDQIEGHPSFYRRFVIRVETRRGQRWAWAYLLRKDQLWSEAKRIPGGDWVAYRAERAGSQ